MERIYDENLNGWAEFLSDQNGEYDIKIDCQTLKMMVQELKERRAADKPLDIKAQLRLVRYKCPNVWDVIAKDFDCPSMFPMGLQSDLIDSKDICCGIGDENCKECWDKALEGDE